MKWIDAIKNVLAEEREPMHYEEIARRILKKGYRTATTTTENSVNSYLSTNPNLFRKVDKGTYELIETSVSVAKSVGGVAPVVVRSCSSYPSGAPEYKCASDFVDSEDLKNLSELEKELFELIVNFRLRLANEYVCFADILDKLDVEILEEEGKPRRQSIDAAHLREKLNELKEQIAEIDRKLQNNPQRQDLYGLRDNMRSVAEKVEDLLSKASDGKVEFDYPILGEFVPGSKPKVVIYLKSIEKSRGNDESRDSVMPAVFVHEMFHAWNYFNAGPGTVLAIDEPMVEFETLYFLQKLKDFMHSQSHSLYKHVLCVSVNRNFRVQNKQRSIGNVAAYGFGYYLFKELSESDIDSRQWIETYSKKSASIKGCKFVKNVEDALIPVYPFQSQKQVMEWFKKIIFDGVATSKTVEKSATAKVGLDVSLRDLVLACIEIIGRKCFDAQEIYAFAPIFKVCVPQCQGLENALKQQLDELVNEGLLDALPHDCYSMKLAGIEVKPTSPSPTTH